MVVVGGRRDEGELSIQIKEVGRMRMPPENSEAELTNQIREVATSMELVRTHRAHERHLCHIHLSASWTSLSRLVRQRWAEQRWLKNPAEMLELLIQRAVHAAVSRESGARQLANIVYGVWMRSCSRRWQGKQIAAWSSRQCSSKGWWWWWWWWWCCGQAARIVVVDVVVVFVIFNSQAHFFILAQEPLAQDLAKGSIPSVPLRSRACARWGVRT